MQRIIELLYKIKENPICYVGKLDIERLYFLLSGYILAMNEFENVWQSDFTEQFQAFVAKKYNDKDTLNWCSIIQKHHSQDETFNVFYELLDEFVEQLDQSFKLQIKDNKEVDNR